VGPGIRCACRRVLTPVVTLIDGQWRPALLVAWRMNSAGWACQLMYQHRRDRVGEAEGQQSALVPLDDLAERLDDDQQVTAGAGEPVYGLSTELQQRFNSLPLELFSFRRRR
jgi:hypothetical protein